MKSAPNEKLNGLHEAGLHVISEMISPAAADSMNDSASSEQFGAFLDELTVTGVFGALWTRQELDHRSRSIATVAILIALRAEEELLVHVPAAIRNGVTIAEIEELIYHSSAYAGVPAAMYARTVALAALRQSKMID